jgi:hypothetical protein
MEYGRPEELFEFGGFEVLTVQEQPAGLVHSALMVNMYLCTGFTVRYADQSSTSFRDVMQTAPAEASATLLAKPTLRQRAMQVLGRIKAAACYPVAILLYH